ncbi:hypothetical protein FOCC_FOCC016817 [Frankliniella occidentalis]|nr:hypothetical protein FOCC_FOCC016817 [Frankliniella occidentalis]
MRHVRSGRHDVLHSQVAVGRLGGRPGADAVHGDEPEPGAGQGQRQEEEGPHRLLAASCRAAQLLRHPLLPVRDALPGQHHRPALHDEPLLRRRVLQLRAARHVLLGPEPGGARRPHGVRVPARHQVHLPQVRCVRHDPEARLALPSAAQHRQREDVHLHLVLVHDPGRAPDGLSALPRAPAQRAVAAPQSVPLVAQADPARGGRGPGQEDRRGRLVAVVHPGRQHGPAHLPRGRVRALEEDRDGRQQQLLISGRAGPGPASPPGQGRGGQGRGQGQARPRPRTLLRQDPAPPRQGGGSRGRGEGNRLTVMSL